MPVSRINKYVTPESTAKPVVAEDLAKIVDQMSLGDIMYFANEAERSAVFAALGVSPPKGALCYLQNRGWYESYNGTAWLALLSTAVTKMDEQVLTGAAASVTFPAISGALRHLLIRAQCRSNTAANSSDLRLQFNGDTGASYYAQAAYGQAASAGAAELLGQQYISISDMAAASAPVGHAGVFAIEIQNYAGTAFYKQLTAQSNFSFGTATAQLIVRNHGGRWQNTVAITSITLFPGAGSFTAGSTFTLYGQP